MEWISVEDRLPEDNGCINSVLFYSCYVRYGYHGSDGWHDETEERFSRPVRGVTHWMPLPDPPGSISSGGAGGQGVTFRACCMPGTVDADHL